MANSKHANASDIPYNSRRRHQLGLVVLSVCVTLGLLLAACPLSIVAIQQRVIAPPRFAVRIGTVELAAPCPPRALICDGPLPWYAIWWGDDQPDGSITYQQLYFIYLKPARHR
jgi:hypothetical protein